MQLIKLVYIAHGYMLGVHGRPLLEEPVEAWQYGPVIPSLYRALKEYRSGPVPCVNGANPHFTFTVDERSVLQGVADKYGRFNGVTLSSATHKPGTPWSQTWSMGSGKSSVISNDLIEKFYSDLKSQKTHSAL